jgi:hypothetical protein
VVTGVVLVVSLFRLTEAGSLTPPTEPTVGTMDTLEETYDSLVSSSFDSSSVAANRDGSALEISKCIIEQITGGTCP